MKPAGPWAPACLALLLAGCASQAPSPPARPAAEGIAAPAPAIAAQPPADPWAARIAEFESRWRARAESAQAQGRWLDAAAAWDLLSALRPDDTELKARHASAAATARSTAAERLQQAQQARKRGDLDNAQRLYLETLALAPGQPAAVSALRAIERERTRLRQAGAGRGRPLPASQEPPAP